MCDFLIRCHPSNQRLLFCQRLKTFRLKFTMAAYHPIIFGLTALIFFATLHSGLYVWLPHNIFARLALKVFVMCEKY